jgi:hypothetical protein
MLEPRQGIGGWKRMGQEMGQDILDNWPDSKKCPACGEPGPVELEECDCGVSPRDSPQAAMRLARRASSEADVRRGGGREAA